MSPWGTECIAVDLNPERFGWIGYYWHEMMTYDGDYPVVAHSLNEFLTKSLDAYEKGWRYYWDDPQWPPLGQVRPEATSEPVEIHTGVTWEQHRRGFGWDGTS